MIATRIKQKDSTFYFAAYSAADLLNRVKFISRFHSEDGTIPAAPIDPKDEVAAFIHKVEREDQAFQREPSKAKIKAILDFYNTADTQPIIPGAILLYSQEELSFSPLSGMETVGNLDDPREPFLIIDGQHRLAALYFYLKENPQAATGMSVPAMIFDKQTDNFAAEMFVTINSTPTKITKSLLVDLYERMSRTEPYKACAARIARRLYEDSDSPLRYKINRLGSRSKQAKWIMQSELFNELCRWLGQGIAAASRRAATETMVAGGSAPEAVAAEPKFGAAKADEVYGKVRDILNASAQVFGEYWGKQGYFITEPVTLKAILRVASKLTEEQWGPPESRATTLPTLLAPWAKLVPDFRADGFYERFAAKGQVERVAKVHQKLEKHLAS